MRRPFRPSPSVGPYRLPRDVADRLAVALAPFRNREASYELALFLGRYWSAPSRIETPFSIDRRALRDSEGLDLTEARIRGAIRVLEEVGFLDRVEPGRGSKYQPTEEGLHRKPITFRLGLEYRAAFETANKRAAAARGRRLGERRAIPADATRRPSTAPAEARRTNSPKSHSVAVPKVYLGELRAEKKESGLPPLAFEPNSPLEAALARLKEGFRRSRGG